VDASLDKSAAVELEAATAGSAKDMKGAPRVIYTGVLCRGFVSNPFRRWLRRGLVPASCRIIGEKWFRRTVDTIQSQLM
jgi:hypothetical protein